MSERPRSRGMRRRSVLSGGRTRRRPVFPLLAAAVALGIVLGTALYLLDSSGDRGGATGSSSASSRSKGASPRGQSAFAGVEGGGASRYAVDLSQPDVVRIRFHERPRAGLLFDLRTGTVL